MSDRLTFSAKMPKVKIEYPSESDDNIDISDVKLECFNEDVNEPHQITSAEAEKILPNFKPHQRTDEKTAQQDEIAVGDEYLLQNEIAHGRDYLIQDEIAFGNGDLLQDDVNFNQVLRNWETIRGNLVKCKNCKKEVHTRGFSVHKRYCRVRLNKIKKYLETKDNSTTKELERIIKPVEMKNTTIKTESSQTPLELIKSEYPDNNSLETVTCPDCYKTYDKINVRQHQCEAQTTSKNIFCNSCRLYFVNSDKLKQHLLNCSYHKLTFKCKYCRMRFGNKSEMRNHKIEMHGISEFKCEHCSKKLMTQGLLGRHMRDHHWGQKRVQRPIK